MKNLIDLLSSKAKQREMMFESDKNVIKFQTTTGPAVTPSPIRVTIGSTSYTIPIGASDITEHTIGQVKYGFYNGIDPIATTKSVSVVVDGKKYYSNVGIIVGARLDPGGLLTYISNLWKEPTKSGVTANEPFFDYYRRYYPTGKRGDKVETIEETVRQLLYELGYGESDIKDELAARVTAKLLLAFPKNLTYTIPASELDKTKTMSAAQLDTWNKQQAAAINAWAANIIMSAVSEALASVASTVQAQLTTFADPKKVDPGSVLGIIEKYVRQIQSGSTTLEAAQLQCNQELAAKLGSSALYMGSPARPATVIEFRETEDEDGKRKIVWSVDINYDPTGVISRITSGQAVVAPWMGQDREAKLTMVLNQLNEDYKALLSSYSLQKARGFADRSATSPELAHQQNAITLADRDSWRKEGKLDSHMIEGMIGCGRLLDIYQNITRLETYGGGEWYKTATPQIKEMVEATKSLLKTTVCRPFEVVLETEPVAGGPSDQMII